MTIPQNLLIEKRKSMTLIYIVEDDVNIREIESFALKNSGYMVEEFECAKDFYKRCGSIVPDLVLLDIMLPDEDGLQIVKRMKETPELRKIPIILITAKSMEIDKVKGLDMGADDYITKPFGVMELISRVKALLRRSQDIQEEKFLEAGNITMDMEKRMVKVDGERIELTYKEFELLKLFIQNSNIVLSRDVIMDRVWGSDYEGESRTIDMHIKTLRHKLKDEGKRIKTVRNVGYMME